MTVPWAMGTREDFGFSGAKTSTSLKNSRAARARTTISTSSTRCVAHSPPFSSLGEDEFEYDGEANAEDSDFEYDGEANESEDESDFEYDGE